MACLAVTHLLAGCHFPASVFGARSVRQLICVLSHTSQVDNCRNNNNQGLDHTCLKGGQTLAPLTSGQTWASYLRQSPSSGLTGSTTWNINIFITGPAKTHLQSSLDNFHTFLQTKLIWISLKPYVHALIDTKLLSNVA